VKAGADAVKRVEQTSGQLPRVKANLKLERRIVVARNRLQASIRKPAPGQADIHRKPALGE
jgi:hypothetical protein